MTPLAGRLAPPGAHGMRRGAALRWLEEWVPDPEARTRILGEAPARLYRIPGGGAASG